MRPSGRSVLTSHNETKFSSFNSRNYRFNDLVIRSFVSFPILFLLKLLFFFGKCALCCVADDSDDVESNLLRPAGTQLRPATFWIRLYHGEDIPQSMLD